MPENDVPDPHKRRLLEDLARGIGGFFREFNRELNAPTPEKQRLAAESSTN